MIKEDLQIITLLIDTVEHEVKSETALTVASSSNPIWRGTTVFYTPKDIGMFCIKIHELGFKYHRADIQNVLLNRKRRWKYHSL